MNPAAVLLGKFKYDFGNNEIIRFYIINGDITEMKTDAITNAANYALWHGAGVANAIAKAGGDVVINESNEYITKNGNLKISKVAVTLGGNLPAKKVFHAVGPTKSNTKHPQLLENTYYNVLQTAITEKVESLSLVPISTKIYGVDYIVSAKALFKSIMNPAIMYPLAKAGVKKIILIDIDMNVLEVFITVFDECVKNYPYTTTVSKYK